MKAHSPAFQWYPKDIQSDPRYRALPQAGGARGAYRDLLDFCWIEGKIPLDDDVICKLIDLKKSQWRIIREKVLALFDVDTASGSFTHGRIEAERAKQRGYDSKAVAAGKKGAKIRWDKVRRQQEIDRVPIDTPLGFDRSPSPPPSPTPPTSTPPQEEEGEKLTALLPERLPAFGPDDLQRDWNKIASTDGLRSCKALSKSRRIAAAARIRENPDEDYWQKVIMRIARSLFCCGENDRGWKADFDFLVRRDTHLKVLEGKYDNRANPLSAPGSKTQGNAEAARRFIERGKELDNATS